jgi:YVTN family beta-propeller protein
VPTAVTVHKAKDSQRTRSAKAALAYTAIGFLALSVILGLALLRDRAFVTSTFLQYVSAILEAASRYVGQLVSAAVFLWGLWGGAHRIWRSRISAPTQTLKWFLPLLMQKIFVPSFLRLVAVVLAVSSGVIGYALLIAPYPFLPPGAGLIVTPDTRYDLTKSFDKFVYVVDAGGGRIVVANRDAWFLPEEIIPIITGELTQGRPSCIAISPEHGEVYVADSANDRVVVIDKLRKQTNIPVGRDPRCLTVTADENKLFVANAAPIPQGSISVISLKQKPHPVVHTIGGVNCPVGLAVTPDGRRLYVATQCGGGHDPVFIVDTATDKVIGTIPDVAVGLTPAISPDGRAAYVARGNPSRISIFDTRDGASLGDLRLAAPSGEVSSMAFTSDAKFLIVGAGNTLRVFALDPNARSYRETASIPLECPPAAIGTSGSTRIYVWLPQSRRRLQSFLMGLSGFQIAPSQPP